MAPGQQTMRPRIVGIDFGGPLEKSQPDLGVMSGPCPYMRHRLDHAAPRTSAVGQGWLSGSVPSVSAKHPKADIWKMAGYVQTCQNRTKSDQIATKLGKCRMSALDPRA